MSDLRFAEEVLVNGGVVFVDDVFNPEWPGVVEGVAAFLRAVPANARAGAVRLCGREAASHHRLAQTSRAPALHQAHAASARVPRRRHVLWQQAVVGSRGTHLHTRKAKSTMVRKQEEMELPARHKSRRVAAYASA